MNREIASENVVPVPRTGNGIWTDWESVPTILFAEDVDLVPRTGRDTPLCVPTLG